MRESDITTLAPPEAPGAGADATIHLRAALEAAFTIAAPAVPPGHLLVAFSLAAPAACLAFLGDRSSELRASMTPSEISSAASNALEGLRGSAIDRRMYASNVLRLFGDILTAETAACVLRPLGSAVDPTEAESLAHVLKRFPAEPAILRAAIGVAREQNDDARLDDLLTRLGFADPTPATVAFVRKMRPQRSSSANATIRAAMLSSYTIDQLAPYVDLACRALRLAPELYIAPFNSWTRDIIDESSGLRTFDPEIVFLSVSIDDLVDRPARYRSPEELEAAGAEALERVVGAARAFKTWASGTPLVVHGFHSVFTGSRGTVDGRDGRSRAEWLAGLNAKLADEMRALPACYVLDVNEAIVTSGGALGDNPKLRHLAAMRLPPSALAATADAYARYIAPLKGLTRKCVVLDLDNTLWGGIVGEEGTAGIRLGTSGSGSEFVEFQEFLRSLTQRGILLAVNSKNNSEDALDVIRTHEAMVLREADFSALRINWEPKTDNMRAIAAQLNIGLDALVFVDDNPDERERMRQILPDVLTVELPRDAALYRSVLERLPQLQTLAITADDRGRLERYQTQQLREREKTSAPSVTDYLHSLEIAVRIGPAKKEQLARIVQLFSKTNQFNVTTKRYSMADVERFASDPHDGLWVLDSKDRFGDHGLVALALVRTGGPTWTIDSFLMSCRVIGYGIETALLAFVAEQARARGASTLAGEFVATAKNAPARDLFERHGFASSGSAGESDRWQLELASPLDFPLWIERTHDVA